MSDTILMFSITSGGFGVFREVPPGFCGISPLGVASAAARIRNKAWIMKREASQSRLRLGPSGVISFEALNVKKAPTRKVTMETKVVSHAYGLSGRPAVESPRMTVFPAMTS